MEQTAYMIGSNTPTEYIKDYTRTIALMFEDMVDYADRNGLDRNEVVRDMVQNMRTISAFSDMNKYRPMPDDTEDMTDAG